MYLYVTGIESRLDYLHDLGIQAVWLSPIYKSPMVDFGYDVSNHTTIDPLFGTLQDFDDLVQALHEKGKVVLQLQAQRCIINVNECIDLLFLFSWLTD